VKYLALLLCAAVLPACAEKRSVNYPETFTVIFAARQPSQVLSDPGSCSLHLASGDKVYSVWDNDGMVHPCVIFPLGTELRGREIRDLIEVLDETVPKPKPRRYFVRDVVMR
jgi:hypothetical protein